MIRSGRIGGALATDVRKNKFKVGTEKFFEETDVAHLEMERLNKCVVVRDIVNRADLMTPGGVVCRYRQTSEGSFSAVLRPIFASKDAFFRIFRDLQDARTFAPLQIQNFRKNSRNFC